MNSFSMENIIDSNINMTYSIIIILLEKLNLYSIYDISELYEINKITQICTQINENFFKDYKKENKNEIFNFIIQIINNLLKRGLKITKQIEKFKNEKEDSPYLYSLLFDFLLLYIIFEEKTKNDIEKIFYLDNKQQYYLCQKIVEYINLDNSPIKKILGLHTRINILENKVKNFIEKEKKLNDQINKLEIELKNKELNTQIQYNENSSMNISENIQFNPKKFSMNDERKNSEDILKDLKDLSIIKNNNIKLDDQEYCQIILKKDYIISQLQSQLENFEEIKQSVNENENEENENEQILADLEEEIEFYKKENDDYKKKYEFEFELVASALYNTGVQFLMFKEQINSMGEENFIKKHKHSLI